MLPELKMEEFETKIIGKLQKAFTVERRSTGDVIYNIRDKKTGRFILRTKRSNQRRVSPWHLEQIKKQLCMTRKEFINFRDCPLSADDYRGLLVERGKYEFGN